MLRGITILLLLALALPSWAALAINVNVSTDSNVNSTTLTSPSFSTGTNELLIAFVEFGPAAAGVICTVTGIATTGVTWVLVKRTNKSTGQSGTAEIWRAFATSALTTKTAIATLSAPADSINGASITVLSFTGADTTGTNGSGAIGATGTGNGASGAPTANLTTTRANSWVMGCGFDWSNSTAVAYGSNQTKIHEYDDSSNGVTCWNQRQTNTTPSSGTNVTINDTAPTADVWNLSIVEILPPVAGGATAHQLPTLGAGHL